MAILTNTSPFLQKLDYSNLSSSEQSYVDALITAGEEWIEKFCDRKFAADDYTDELHNGTGENCIFVKNPPINSLTDIDITCGDTTTTYAATKFDYISATGEIRFKENTFLTASGYFTEGFQNVQITYNGGFSSVPSVVQMLVADFVIEQFDPTLKDELIEREKIGDYAYSRGSDYFSRLNYSMKRMLSSYRIRRVML